MTTAATPPAALPIPVIEATSPRDGALLEPVPCTPVDSLPRLVSAARGAHERRLPLRLGDRARDLERLRDALFDRQHALLAAITAETGKPEVEALLHEVLPIADLAAYWSAEGPRLLAAEAVAIDALSYPGKRARVERVARGVLGLITPWNFPVAIPLRTLFPALLAGNAVVWKPSEHTPRSALVVADAIAEVFGPDLVSVVVGRGDAGAALVSAGVDAVAFTGSVRTGRAVAHLAAEALIPVGLELGGKDAALVLDDADLERAARGILWAGMLNAGQSCAAVERVYVARSIEERFTTLLVELATALRPGDDYGSLTTAAQLALVEAQLVDARARGAVVRCGGTRLGRPGLWLAPAVVTGVAADASLACDETFGPVLPVFAVDSDDEAVAAANRSPFGLTASVWTRSAQRGRAVASRLRAGVVTINDHGLTAAIPALPWSGVGDSGYGVTNSPHALDLLTRPRALVEDTRRAKAERWWFPYRPGLSEVARALIELRRGGRGPLARGRAARAMVRGLLRRA